jgi:hypothetical protein
VTASGLYGAAAAQNSHTFWVFYFTATTILRSGMAMLPKLHTLNALSTETGHDRRAIAKILAGTPPDGRFGKHPAWRMQTFLRVREGQTLVAPVGPDDKALDNLERVAERAQQALDMLSAEESIERRRELVKGGLLRVFEQLERAFSRVEADNTPEGRTVTEPFITRVLGSSIGQILQLCEWQLEERPFSASSSGNECTKPRKKKG